MRFTITATFTWYFPIVVFAFIHTQRVHCQNRDVPSYGVDVSFPIHSKSVSTNYDWLPHNLNPGEVPTPQEFEGISVQVCGDRYKFYEEYMQGCRDHWEEKAYACDNVESDRIKQNINQPQSMVNFTETGYKKMKTPDHIFKKLLDFWEVNKAKEEDEKWFPGNIFVNYWDVPSTMIDVHDAKFEGGGGHLVDQIHDSMKDIIQEWTGQNIIPSSLYGVRVYKEGAVLAPHVDRNPLISSAIVNVAQDVDEPWPLEVIGHDGKAKNVTMEPGDLVLYESHSIVHGRPFPLKGRYFANLFIHFEPDLTMRREAGNSLPLYVLEGSIEAKAWLKSHEKKKGERYEKRRRRKERDERQHAAHLAAGDGDLFRLKEIIDEDESALHYEDINGWLPIHEASRGGHYEVLQYLIEKGSAINHRTNEGHGPSPLQIAIDRLRQKHPAIDLLVSHGATIDNFNEL